MASSHKYPKRKYHVFISHAGEDKQTIAIPLRDMLSERSEGRLKAFVDDKDMIAGDDSIKKMSAAMAKADLAVFILSPEFVAKKWPMRELLFFLKREQDAEKMGVSQPTIVPVFYRLTISEIYLEPRFERKCDDGSSLYKTTRFYERRDKGEPEANPEIIRNALQQLHRTMGVENTYYASNDPSAEPFRVNMLDAICEAILRAFRARTDQDLMKEHGSGQPNHADMFQPHFLQEPLRDVILDFSLDKSTGQPLTQEGRIKYEILRSDNESNQIFAILGHGGVGKSTIMTGLAHETEVRKEFSDGIHFISLGRDADKATVFRQVCKIMRDSGAVKTEEMLQTEKDVDGAIDKAASWFQDKNCLFLIDDAWTSKLETTLFSRLCDLVRGEKRSAVVFTTRESEVASITPRAIILRVAPRMTQGVESQNILFLHAGVLRRDSQRNFVTEPIMEVLDVCNGLPFSLAAAGKSVNMMRNDIDYHGIDVWRVYAEILKTCCEQLLHQNVGQYENLHVTLLASIAVLKKRWEGKLGFETRLSFAAMHRRLCVLLKKSKAPASMLKYLWELQSNSRAIVVGMRFVQVGLAELEYRAPGSGAVWNLRLHDSLHDFSVIEAKHRGEVLETHKVLLSGYSRSDPGLRSFTRGRTKWWSKLLIADGNIHRNVCRHLREAGQVDELVELLKTPQWITRQLEVNEFFTLDADFTTGIEALLKTNHENVLDDESVLLLLRGAVQLSSGLILRNPREVWFQLYGRLAGHQVMCEAVGKYLFQMRTSATERWARSLNSFLEAPGGAMKRIFHTDGVITCISILDKERIACGCSNSEIVILNLVQGATERAWKAHMGEVDAIASGKGGKRVATGSTDRTAKVWDVSAGTCLRDFRGHSRGVTSIAFMNEDERAVSGSLDGTVQVWDIDSGQIVAVFQAGVWIYCVATFPDSQRVVSGGADGALRIWNVTSRSQVGDAIAGHEPAFRVLNPEAKSCLVVTPDGRRIISAFPDNTVRVWRVETLEQIRVFTSLQQERLLSVSITTDGRYVVSVYVDGNIGLREMTSEGLKTYVLKDHASGLVCASVLESSNVLISSGHDKQLRLWDLAMLEERPFVYQSAAERLFSRNHGFREVKVALTRNGSRAVSASSDGSLRFWNAFSGQQSGATLRWHEGGVTTLEMMPDGNRVVCVHNGEELRVWDMDSHEQVAEMSGYHDRINCLAITPDGDRVVTGSGESSTLCVWDFARMNGNQFPIEFPFGGQLSRVFVSEDGLRVVTVATHVFRNPDTDIMVWDMETHQRLRHVKENGAWSLPRRHILQLVGEETEDTNNNVEIKLRSLEVRYRIGEQETILGTMDSEVVTWAFSPEGSILCVGLDNGKIGFMKIEDAPRLFTDLSRRLFM